MTLGARATRTNTAPGGGPRAARAANLRYVADSVPGIRRVRTGRGFRYTAADGRAVRASAALERIRKLAIPPAWTDVWICPDPNGHLQATGRDARGRKQYRYHAAWRENRDETKYTRLIAFAEALPRVRARVKRDLGRPGHERAKVLATVVRLLDLTGMRVGNEEYVRANRSFGLTTLRDHHVQIAGASLRFQYRGKSGRERTVRLTDRRLAAIVRRCQDLPGYDLFQYLDAAGKPQRISSSDVNDYLRRCSGDDFTAKHFRTWNGTVAAALALVDIGAPTSATSARKNLNEAIARTARELGNTPAVCRKSYVHPAVPQSYANGRLLEVFGGTGAGRRLAGLSRDEARVLALLRAHARAGSESLERTLERSLARRGVRGRRAAA